LNFGLAVFIGANVVALKIAARSADNRSARSRRFSRPARPGAEMPARANEYKPEDRNFEITSPAIAVFLLLICADLGFTLLHLVGTETDWLRGTRTSLEAEGGPAETFQYLKEFWVMVCMAAAFVFTRRAVFVSWALIFLFLLADDSAQLHENVGSWLGGRFAFSAPFGLRSKDIGELLFAGTAGLFMIAVVGAGLWRGTEHCRRVSRNLGILIVSLAVVGIVVDVLHVIAYFGKSLWAQVLLVVEDGGEMVVMSAITAYAFQVATHRGQTRLDLWSVVKTVLAWDVTRSWRPAPVYSRTKLSGISVSPAARIEDAP
jgi:hypothetical protein